MLTTVRKNVPPSRRVAFALGGAALLVAGILLAAPKPWQGRPAPGEIWRVLDYARVYSWWAGAMNAVLLGALAATTRWWMKPSAAGLYAFARPAFPRWFWPMALAATLMCAVFGAMRLRHSFWDDEVYAMRRAIHGQWREDAQGRLRFRPVKWTDTLWFFDKPQHVFHSVITRLTLDAWRAVAKPKGLQFREDVARLPSYLAGVLSVGTLALLLWRLGFPGAGVIAAILTVLHPWHIRYASELRAYSLMLFLLPLCYLFLVEALTTGRWRWWGAFGAGLFFLMYSNALNIYPALGMAACAAGAIVLRWRDPEAPAQAMRLAVSGVAAGMLFLQLMLPCVPQFAEYLHTTAVQGQLDWRWLSSYLGLLFAGAPWSSTGRMFSPYMELFPWAAANPAKFILLVVTAGWLFVVGVRRLVLGGRLPALVTLALLLPAPVAYAVSRMRHQYLFEWYLLFLLPGMIAAVAVGLDALRQRLSKNRVGSAAGIVIVAVLIGCYAAYTTPQRTWLLTRPLQQIRESAEATRPTLNPFAAENSKILTASFIGPPDPYDANIIRFVTLLELSKLMTQADAGGKTLFINFGFMPTVNLRFPAMLKIINDPTLFEKVVDLQGYEPINDRYVYRYLPGSSAGRKISTEVELTPLEKTVENRYDAMEAAAEGGEKP